MKKIYLIMVLGLTALLSGCAAGMFGSGGHHSNTAKPQEQRSIAEVKADAAISSQVKAHFAKDVILKNLNVTTYRGVVTLYGKVPTHNVMERAIRLAKSVNGVKNVRSGIRLR